MDAEAAGRAEGAPDVRIWQSRYDGKTWSAPEVHATYTYNRRHIKHVALDPRQWN